MDKLCQKEMKTEPLMISEGKITNINENFIKETKTECEKKPLSDIMIKKKCTKCGVEKKLGEFNKKKDGKFGVYSHCKNCKSNTDKKYYIKNKTKILISTKQYREKHSDKIRIEQKIYRKANKNEIKLYKQKYKKKNKSKIYKWHKNKLKTDINYRLIDRLRHRLYDALCGKIKNGSAIKDLGCSIPELKLYLESKFQMGMTWDNWSRDGWHIDHIKPLSSFDLTDRKQFLEAVHYTNLQPLWAKDNLSKGNRLL
jgi:hypothetical protein